MYDTYIHMNPFLCNKNAVFFLCSETWHLVQRPEKEHPYAAQYVGSCQSAKQERVRGRGKNVRGGAVEVFTHALASKSTTTLDSMFVFVSYILVCELYSKCNIILL